MKCFYHSVDLDGHCSGAIVKMKFPECEMLGINYGDEFPWERIEDETVFMVDFSLQPFDQMLRLGQMANLVWIDHHKTAIRDEEDALAKRTIREPIRGLRGIGRAGCELAWEFLCPQQPMPIAVRLLGRYDVWDHSTGWQTDIIPFQYGMRMRETHPGRDGGLWHMLFHDRTDTIAGLMCAGGIAYQHHMQLCREHAKHCAFPCTIDGIRFVAMAGSPKWSSDAFGGVWDPERFDAMMQIYSTRSGMWTLELYSDGQVDVGDFARRHGGGGHANAAGFQVERLPDEVIAAQAAARGVVG